MDFFIVRNLSANFLPLACSDEITPIFSDNMKCLKSDEDVQYGVVVTAGVRQLSGSLIANVMLFF